MIKKENLKKKGWADKEIRKVEYILYSEKDDKNLSYRKQMHETLFWLSLVVMVVANFLVLLSGFPYLLLAGKEISYLGMGLFGFIFGSLFTSLIIELEHLKTHHHIFAMLFFPLVTCINLLILFFGFDGREAVFGSIGYVLSIAAVYSLCFLGPYLVYHVIGAKHKKIL